MKPDLRVSGRRILVLVGRRTDDVVLLDALHEQGDLRIIRNLDQVPACLNEAPVDLFVADADMLVPLARQLGLIQSDQFFERFGLGVCIVSHRGELVWANSKLRNLPLEVVDKVRSTCTGLYDAFSRHDLLGQPLQELHETIDVAREFFLELIVTPLPGPDGRIGQVIAIVRDVSARMRLQEKLNAIDQAGRELVSLNAEALADMDIGQRLGLLEEKIISIGRNLLGFDHFAIRVLEKSTGRLDPLVTAGQYGNVDARPLYAKEEGNGIAGYVAATGRSYLCSDVANDARYLPCLKDARCSLTVPLSLNDRVIGVFNVESTEPGKFNEDDRQFAEIFARHIAMALNVLQLLVVERHAVQDQVANDVEAEMAAPLNRIVNDVTALIGQYASNEALCDKLRGILAHVDLARQAMESVTECEGVAGLLPEGAERCPILGGKRILIADDEDIIRETIAQVLSMQGAYPTMASDGAEALRLVRSQSFDLILSDIKMPNSNGYEVFSAARERSPNVPVILTTGFGYDPNHAIVKASREGLTGVLFKPFKVEQLLDQVRLALAPSGR